MRDLLESEEWRNTKARIPLALGKDVYGHPIIADLAEMPHLLIAGSTGSGKSVCINSIIASLLYRFPPDELRFVMIDPKVVELQHYNTLPHLVVPVVTDPKKVILALRWVVNEMEKRYQIFAQVGVRNFKSFNDRPKNKPPRRNAEPELPAHRHARKRSRPAPKGSPSRSTRKSSSRDDDDIVIPDQLRYIVVIIDELADLMQIAPADVEMAIARITQMARAAGIHCIVATQRPQRRRHHRRHQGQHPLPHRLPGRLQGRLPHHSRRHGRRQTRRQGRHALPAARLRQARSAPRARSSPTRKSTTSSTSSPARASPAYEVEIHQQLSQPAAAALADESGIDEDEDLIQQCIEVIRSEQKASVSLLQRRLRLGYTRAARIMDELEDRGIVGPGNGAEPRDILIDLDGTGADGAAEDSRPQ